MTSPPGGLRERKKAKTRAAIRRHALRLFHEQGYAATTVDQIAEAAEVSPSTFFRYFATKDDVVLYDDFDPLVVEAVLAQPADVKPIAAIRNALREVFTRVTTEDWAQERQRQQLLQTVPELRAKVLQQYAQTVRLVTEVVAEREGLAPDNFSARVLAGAVVGTALAATVRILEGGLHDLTDLDQVDEALTLLENGLPLTPDVAGEAR